MPETPRIVVARALLEAERHSGPELIERTGLGLTTIYANLRSLVGQGWIKRVTVPGTARREYIVTPEGRRHFQFLVELKGEQTSTN